MGNALDQAKALQRRTRTFAVRVVRLVDALPRTTAARELGRQLLRSATSVAANYRAACRARSKAEFIAKMSIVVEEADETTFWLELFEDAGVVPAERLAELRAEADELLRIMSASRRTAKAKR